METILLALCFFASLVVNLLLMAGLLAKRQKTAMTFGGKTLQIQMHEGNAHLITGLVLYEKGRHAEAVALLQEATRQDPDDRMADAMLQIALNAGPAAVAGLPPARERLYLPALAGHDADGIIDAVVRDVADTEALTAEAVAGAETELAKAVKEGLAMVRRGEITPALVHFEQLTQAHPDSRIARTGRAIALKHAGREDEAAEVLRATLAADTETQPADTEAPAQSLSP